MNVPALQTGDVILFDGHGIVSLGIQTRTCWPWERPRFSHVELLAWITPTAVTQAREKMRFRPTDDRLAWLYDFLGDGKWLSFGSTMMATGPCEILGQRIAGVQAHGLQSRVDAYDGDVYRMRWKPEFAISLVEQLRLARSLICRLGTPYDARKAAMLGTCITKRFWKYDLQDRSSVFCSDMVVKQIDDLQPGLRVSKMKNAKHYSPARIHREWTGGGRCFTPELILKTEDMR